MKGENRMKRKGKSKMLIAINVMVILVVVGAGGGLLFTAGERREAKNLPIAAVNFKQLQDGTYVGEYQGGMYKWRANRVQVTVSSSKVTDIKILEQTEKRPSELTDELFGRVIRSQSLQVDTISGATLTSKAYLKGVENALNIAHK
jgi:uncharacterized protein with FMN-binding domain